MVTREFELYHLSTTEPAKVVINIDDEFHFTSIDGDFKGSFVLDEDSEFGISTEDEELKPYIESLGMYLKDSKSKSNLGETLLEKYGENIQDYQFINDDVLELIAHPDTDLEGFGSEIKDLIYDDVEFESKLSVVISKEDEDYTVNFDIN